MTTRRVLVVVGALVGVVLHAQVLTDPGELRCALWTETRANSHSNALDAVAVSETAWLQGYFAGAMDLGVALSAQLDPNGQAQIRQGVVATASLRKAEALPIALDRFCADHPTETVHVAGLRLLKGAYALLH